MRLFLVIALSLVSFLAGAQIIGDPEGGGNPSDEVPISGIEILLVAGGALGLRALSKKDKSKS